MTTPQTTQKPICLSGYSGGSYGYNSPGKALLVLPVDGSEISKKLTLNSGTLLPSGTLPAFGKDAVLRNPDKSLDVFHPAQTGGFIVQHYVPAPKPGNYTLTGQSQDIPENVKFEDIPTGTKVCPK